MIDYVNQIWWKHTYNTNQEIYLGLVKQLIKNIEDILKNVDEETAQTGDVPSQRAGFITGGFKTPKRKKKTKKTHTDPNNVPQSHKSATHPSKAQTQASAKPRTIG